MNRGLHRFALVLACWTLLLIVAGGLVTSNDAGLSVPDWPLSYGKLMPTMEGGIFYEHGHRMVATVDGMLMIVMAVWLWARDDRRWIRWLGWIALLAVIAQGVLGGLTVIYLLPPAVSVSHACLAQLYFSTTVALALFTSREWLAGAQEIPENREAPLRVLALLTPLCVLGQLALGAAARHKALGTIWHICGSSVVTGVVLFFSVRILLHYRDYAALRKSALALLGITFVQVFLGIAAYMSRIATVDAPQPMPIMILFTVLHVATGALTMAASVIAAIQVYRNVRHPEAQFAARGVALA
ncbi:MAG TPA: COX15/CtaA family protein [Bryobacteraceae bacterium]